MTRTPIYAEEAIESRNADDEGSEIAQLTALTIDSPIIGAKLPNWLHSPILRYLPPEIIAVIFTFTLPDVSFSRYSLRRSDSRPKKDGTTTPLVLGAVCKDWRTIVWSTPALWSSMIVHLTKPTIITRRSLIKDWLARSGQLPLSIRISFGSMHKLSKAARAEIISLAEIVNQYSSRWYHFDLSSPPHTAKYFRAQKLHAPILESFRLHCDDPHFHFITCPRVRKVHLVFGRYTDFSWNNVTHLRVESILLEDCLKILRNTPLLVRAEVVDIYQIRLHPSNPIITPLKSLTVNGTDSVALFRHITCPALDELILDWRTSFDIEEDCIVPFLAGSSRLRCFTILNHAPDSQFIDILRAVPSLTKVVLSPVFLRYLRPGGVAAENILNILNMVLSSQSNPSEPALLPFLPHLETFDYQGPFSYNQIYSLPPSMSAAQRRLQYVKFDFFSIIRIPENAIPFFLRLVELGITVHVWSGGKDILQSSIDYYTKEIIAPALV